MTKQQTRKISGYGWHPDLPDARDHLFSSYLGFCGKYKLTKGDVDLRSSCPPVYDQGDLGSCSSNAIGGMFEFVDKKMSGKDFMPSRLFIYYNERSVEGTTDQDAGALIRDGIKSVNRQGVCAESMWPYDVSKFAVKPPDSCYVEALNHQSIRYLRINRSLLEMQTCLAQGFPFVFGFTVYEGFESDVVARTGVVSMPKPSEEVVGGHAVLCMHEDTKISLLDGREITLKDASKEFGEKEFWVYSSTLDGEIKPGRAHSLRKTGTNRELVSIHLDNGEIIKCTPDHRILMRNGEYKEAGHLVEGDSLMPLYRKKSTKKEMPGYDMVLHQKNKKWELTHRMVARETGKYNDKEKRVIHHKDFNKLNNSPDNLEQMSWDDHTKLHMDEVKKLKEYSKSEVGREKSRELMQNLWNDQEWKEKTLKQNSENGKKVSNILKEEGRCGFQTQDKKVLSERSKIIGKQNVKFLHTPEAGKKSVEKRKERFDNDLEYRDQCKTIAVKNINKYNEDLKSGKIQLTENQIKARQENGRFAVLRNVWNKHYKDEYKTFEEYMEFREQQKIENKPNNHKVIKVENGMRGDVYDLTVDEHHNFALSAGIFVHNCVGYNKRSKMMLVRNSWGADWGLGGYFWLPYGYFTNANLSDDFWTIRSVEV